MRVCTTITAEEARKRAAESSSESDVPEAGPSKDKGKGIDPCEFGGLSVANSNKLDPETQKAKLERLRLSHPKREGDCQLEELEAKAARLQQLSHLEKKIAAYKKEQ